MNTEALDIVNHPVVSEDRWLTERKALLAREKELKRVQDQVARERRALPWTRIEKNYVFETSAGKRTLADLFDGRSQLLVQHFMLGPGWKEGCPRCSFMADHSDGMNLHLAHRDVTLVAVSHAPLHEIEPFKKRMGWRFEWVSACGSDFNFDLGVSFSDEQRKAGDGKVDYNYQRIALTGDEMPGISVFHRNEAGEVFHTYSTYGRGVEVMMGTYSMLDLMPKGRGERNVPDKLEWVRHHDRYESRPDAGGSCCLGHR